MRWRSASGNLRGLLVLDFDRSGWTADGKSLALFVRQRSNAGNTEDTSSPYKTYCLSEQIKIENNSKTVIIIHKHTQ